MAINFSIDFGCTSTNRLLILDTIKNIASIEKDCGRCNHPPGTIKKIMTTTLYFFSAKNSSAVHKANDHHKFHVTHTILESMKSKQVYIGDAGRDLSFCAPQ